MDDTYEDNEENERLHETDSLQAPLLDLQIVDEDEKLLLVYEDECDIKHAEKLDFDVWLFMY